MAIERRTSRYSGDSIVATGDNSMDGKLQAAIDSELEEMRRLRAEYWGGPRDSDNDQYLIHLALLEYNQDLRRCLKEQRIVRVRGVRGKEIGSHNGQ